MTRRRCVIPKKHDECGTWNQEWWGIVPSRVDSSTFRKAMSSSGSLTPQVETQSQSWSLSEMGVWTVDQSVLLCTPLTNGSVLLLHSVDSWLLLDYVTDSPWIWCGEILAVPTVFMAVVATALHWLAQRRAHPICLEPSCGGKADMLVQVWSLGPLWQVTLRAIMFVWV